ncbi:MAG: ATP-binding protein [Candidatus Aminicenantes bacterium]|nr:ATP-binding protein [Candidatus Aminicenantes bacterium]
MIYYTVEELLQQLKKRADTPVAKQRGRAYVKNSLVVLDELGYQSLDRHEAHLFFQFISARYMKGSTIITSNRSVKEWVEIFSSDEMATTAILDRLFHKAHIFNIDGCSYRLKDFNQLVEASEKQ